MSVDGVGHTKRLHQTHGPISREQSFPVTRRCVPQAVGNLLTHVVLHVGDQLVDVCLRHVTREVVLHRRDGPRQIVQGLIGESVPDVSYVRTLVQGELVTGERSTPVEPPCTPGFHVLLQPVDVVDSMKRPVVPDV